MLAGHLAGKAAEDLCFTSPDGAVLRNQNFRKRGWDKAVLETGLDGLTPHDLRLTAASAGDRLRGDRAGRLPDGGHSSPGSHTNHVRAPARRDH